VAKVTIDLISIKIPFTIRVCEFSYNVFTILILTKNQNKRQSSPKVLMLKVKGACVCMYSFSWEFVLELQTCHMTSRRR